MKQLWLAIRIGFMVLLSPVLLAQGVDSLKAYYPLHVGDYWEFEIDETGFVYRAWRSVTGDTTFEDGRNYLIITHNDEYGTPNVRFERVTDSLEVVRYFSNDSGSGEQLVYRLDAVQGDSWVSSDSLTTVVVTLDSIFEAEMFGEIRINKRYRFEEYDKSTGRFLQESFEVLTKGVGFSYLQGGDGVAELGTWTLKGAVIDGVQYGDVSSVDDQVPFSNPRRFRLYQNYPNPFNSETRIDYNIVSDSPERIIISISNIRGEEIATLSDRIHTSGFYSVSWDGKDKRGRHVSSGVYLCRLVANGFVDARKIMVLK